MNPIIRQYHSGLAVSLALLIICSTSQAANFDIKSDDIFDKPELNTDTDQGFSILESFQSSEVDEKKESYQSVLELVKQNKLDKAEEKVKALLKQYPEESEYHSLQALLQTLKKNPQGAVKSYEQALKLNPNSQIALLGLATISLETNDLKSAEDSANKALALNPKLIKAYFLKADIAYKQKNDQEVESALSTALNRVKGDKNLETQVTENLFKFYLLKKQPEKALTLTQNLAKNYPDDKQSLSLLAKAQILNKKQEEGEQTLLKIINQDEKDIDHRLFLAQITGDQEGKQKAALDLINEALKIDPNNGPALTLKTALLIRTKNFEEALNQANYIEAQFPKLAVGKMLKADVYLAQNELEKALDINQQAYKIQPNPKLLNNIISLLTTQGKTDEAIKMLENYLDKNNQDLDAHFKVANLFYVQKNYPKAESHYQFILKEKPDNAIVLNNLAMLYQDQNDPKSLDYAKQAYNKSPNSAAIADTYGTSLLKQGHNKEALETLKKAAELAPTVYDIQFHLAKAYDANGNTKTAIEILEKIVSIQDKFTTQESAVGLLNELKGK
ncbi:tetratricopeptide repeat protein [Methylicorpusculum sp.]|uniref:tetratricopeptide repeat protein n=1 Tax=Methylicorpusculum sp. TaxID=2713644 RepID=UPI0027260652|nr:tetratricopeptide repeat protein [Methylicorpusculum sp.]MDO8846447.1 tetratricopeptide repeat protein [Methylicorpusculum sp.]